MVSESISAAATPRFWGAPAAARCEGGPLRAQAKTKAQLRHVDVYLRMAVVVMRHLSPIWLGIVPSCTFGPIYSGNRTTTCVCKHAGCRQKSKNVFASCVAGRCPNHCVSCEVVCRVCQSAACYLYCWLLCCRPVVRDFYVARCTRTCCSCRRESISPPGTDPGNAAL